MGLRSDIQDDIAEAFDTDLSDAVQSFTYREISQVYDPVTNSTTETYADYSSRGVFTNFRRERITDTSILPTDVRLIILEDELAVIPESENQVLVGSFKYIVLAASIDPAKAAWVLQCRQ